MPKIGDTYRKKQRCGTYTYYIWHACILCGKERWVTKVHGKARYDICGSCCPKLPQVTEARLKAHHNLIGEKHWGWKGGRIKDRGYYRVRIYPNDFFYPMAMKSGFVMEHRLVVAKALGRCLHSWEIVHHKHAKYPAGSIEDKQDNRYPENLQLVSGDRHTQITILERRIELLEREKDELKQLLHNALINSLP